MFQKEFFQYFDYHDNMVIGGENPIKELKEASFNKKYLNRNFKVNFRNFKNSQWYHIEVTYENPFARSRSTKKIVLKFSYEHPLDKKGIKKEAFLEECKDKSKRKRIPKIASFLKLLKTYVSLSEMINQVEMNKSSVKWIELTELVKKNKNKNENILIRNWLNKTSGLEFPRNLEYRLFSRRNTNRLIAYNKEDGTEVSFFPYISKNDFPDFYKDFTYTDKYHQKIIARFKKEIKLLNFKEIHKKVINLSKNRRKNYQELLKKLFKKNINNRDFDIDPKGKNTVELNLSIKLSRKEEEILFKEFLD